jgi:metallophosphoesterase (TIGR00282 family)
VECAVMNLQGRTYMASTDCPFRKADTLLSQLNPEVKVRFVDFHAEVTSEKVAMGWYLDGRVSAMVGTHTHIPTADTRILPGGTAYQTDCGMTGPYHSVIGVETELILQRFLSGMPVRMEAAKKGAELHSVIVDVDDETGRARAVRRHMINGD